MAAMTPWMIAGGVGLQALGTYQQGQAAAGEAANMAAVAQYNAKVQEQEAKAIENQTEYRQKLAAQEAERTASTLRAGLGASGAVVSEGTPLLLQAKQAAEAELDQLLIGYEGNIGAEQARREAAMRRMQAGIYSQQAGNLSMAGAIGAGSTLLTGFGNWADQRYQARLRAMTPLRVGG